MNIAAYIDSKNSKYYSEITSKYSLDSGEKLVLREARNLDEKTVLDKIKRVFDSSYFKNYTLIGDSEYSTVIHRKIKLSKTLGLEKPKEWNLRKGAFKMHALANDMLDDSDDSLDSMLIHITPDWEDQKTMGINEASVVSNSLRILVGEESDTSNYFIKFECVSWTTVPKMKADDWEKTSQSLLEWYSGMTQEIDKILH